MAQTQEITFQAHRFDFTNEMTTKLDDFARIHRFDDRHTFKDAWKSWTTDTDIAPLIVQEIDYFTNLGFKGDVLDKMFKSARYYYRKKMNKQLLDDQEDDLTHLEKQFKYVAFRSSFLKQIDTDITEQLNNEVEQSNPANQSIVISLSQTDAYNQFCETHKPEIYEEFIAMKTKYGTIPSNISAKLKKTYKNRFYMGRATFTEGH